MGSRRSPVIAEGDAPRLHFTDRELEDLLGCAEGALAALPDAAVIDAVAREVAEAAGAVVDELRRSKAQLAEAQALARIGSWEWDVAANHVVWSDELYRIYGLEPGAIEPNYEEFLSRVHPEDRESVDARNRKAFADHAPFEDVKRILRPTAASSSCARGAR